MLDVMQYHSRVRVEKLFYKYLQFERSKLVFFFFSFVLFLSLSPTPILWIWQRKRNYEVTVNWYPWHWLHWWTAVAAELSCMFSYSLQLQITTVMAVVEKIKLLNKMSSFALWITTINLKWGNYRWRRREEIQWINMQIIYWSNRFAFHIVKKLLNFTVYHIMTVRGVNNQNQLLCVCRKLQMIKKLLI